MSAPDPDAAAAKVVPNEELADELEALSAIFGDDLTVDCDSSEVLVRINRVGPGNRHELRAVLPQGGSKDANFCCLRIQTIVIWARLAL